MSKMCEKLGVTRAGYYKYLKTKGKKKKESSLDRQRKEYITIIYHEHNKNFGYRKIHAVLRDKNNIDVSEKIVRRLMRELGLKSQARKEKKQSISGKTIPSAGHIYANLLKRDFSTTKLSEKWVTDVTEFPIDSKKLYLSAVMDLHDNYIVGYQLSHINDIQLVEDSLLYALEIRAIDEKLIIHSDRGMQYRSNRWKELMETYTINPSMSRKANCIDNACIESFFSFVKAERKELKVVKSIEEAKQIVHDYIRYYNHRRIQGVLNYRTPAYYAKAS
ncbi:IS3 family transposase [Pseudoneobacillus rhizosphaerae]|nr:IS3 family transposase [Pseudoneobacillus rhizosphaerae]